MGGDGTLASEPPSGPLSRALDRTTRLVTSGRRLGFRFLLRSGLGRAILPPLLALTRRPPDADLDKSIFPRVDQAALLTELRTRGVFLGLNLPRVALSEI